MIRSIIVILLVIFTSGCRFPKDSDGKTPSGVVQEFLDEIELDCAQDYLLSGSVEKINDSWYSGYSYKRYCKRLSRYENCKLSTSKGLSGYWEVRLIGNIKGFPRSKRHFSLKRVNEKWIIDETGPHVPFELPKIDHAARESFASFIIEIVSPPSGHHQLSLVEHRDSIEVRRENYERALKQCSARVNTIAMHATSLERFFNQNLPFLHEDVRSPLYFVNEDNPGEIRIVLFYFKLTPEGDRSGFDYWTCLLIETEDGWKSDFHILTSMNGFKNLDLTEQYTFGGGDGVSRESAIIIEGAGPTDYPVAEEYWRAKYHPDWRVLDCVLVWDSEKNSKTYDDVDYITAEGQKRRVYFDVTEPFWNRKRN